MLAVRVPRVDLPGLTVDLRGQDRAARAARRATAAALVTWQVPRAVADSVVLLAAELVTNAVSHTGRVRHLRLRRLPDRVVVEVADTDPRLPRRMADDPTAEGGRGLRIVTALSSGWGVRRDGSGKVVWCEVTFGSA